jgi:hypothetical protein
VHVFFSGHEFERVSGKLIGDPIEPVANRRHLIVREDSCASETANVSERSVNVVPPQSNVERQAFGEGKEIVGRCGTETPVPQGLG